MPLTTTILGGLPLPEDIPFQLIGASPDMMDIRFCNKQFPFEFRTSLAISAYEPSEKDLPVGFCGLLTYLKITVSITGYKPTREELASHIVTFPNIPTEHLFDDFEYICRTYFPCFGSLLNVAVFPNGDKETPLDKYPHIVAFEPKTRDLKVASTLDGEVLNASSHQLHTDFSSSSTKSTSVGVEGSSETDGKIPGTDVGLKTKSGGKYESKTEKERSNTIGNDFETKNEVTIQHD